MAVCGAITRDGGRCRATVGRGVAFCFNHDPARAEERRRNAARAGRSKQSGEIRDVKLQIQALVDGMLAGDVHRARAAVAGQLLNVKLRALSLERDLRETELLEGRVVELEEMVEGRWTGTA